MSAAGNLGPEPAVVPFPALPSLPIRRPDGHKGTFGTVIVIGGSRDGGGGGGRVMLGAPVITARAALRGGCGLVKLVMPAPLLGLALSMLPSATGFELPTDPSGEYLPHVAAEVIDAAAGLGPIGGGEGGGDADSITATVLAIGPGLGSGEGPAAAVLRVITQRDRHAVLDADALNVLATLPNFVHDLHAPSVITPHPGEFRRLAKVLGLRGDPAADADRARLAQEAAQRMGTIVVLKGHRTVVSDGLQTWTNSTGSAALATAGSGDALTGLIASLIAQFVAPPQEARPFPMPPRPLPVGRPLSLFDAARLAVMIHGLAADKWCQRNGASAGLMACELCDEFPAVMFPHAS